MQPFLDNDEFVSAVIRSVRDKLAGNGDWATLDARISASLQANAHLPLTWLRTRQGLSATEERVLWFMIAHELDAEVRHAIRQLGTEDLVDVTLGTLHQLVYADSARLLSWRELGTSGQLRSMRYLVRTDDAREAPQQRQTFRIAPRILALAHGEIGLDEEVRSFASMVAATASVDELVMNASTVEAAKAALARSRGLVVAYGRKGSGRRALLAACAVSTGRPKPIVIDARRLGADANICAEQLRAIKRECVLLGRLPLITFADSLVASGNSSDRLQLLEDCFGDLVLATAEQPLAREWKVATVQIPVAQLTGQQCALLWRRSLPGASESDGEFLAGRYPLAPALIHAVGKAATEAASGTALRPEHVDAAMRVVIGSRLGNFAKRVEVTQTWDDLVIEHEQAQSITELIARIRQRRTVYEQWGFAAKVGKGLGVSALFSGPPGTGKTMVAALIAKELGLELYQVDMGKLVSKWIGETEKQLGEMFDAAEAGHAILLFDEADSLFGKRTEVRSSNDRYANLETNYLLQRLESFTGICLLTTNHESNIDPAFQRRLSLHLRFGVPDEDEREKLWRAMMPAAAPIEPSVDFTGLARRFAMTGGYIRNAALRAAFLAADEGTPIGSVHLEHAARLEYEGMGKIVTPPSTWPSRLSSAL